MHEPAEVESRTLVTVASDELVDADVEAFMRLGYVRWRDACWVVTDHRPRYAGGGRYGHEFQLTRVADDTCG